MCTTAASQGGEPRRPPAALGVGTVRTPGRSWGACPRLCSCTMSFLRTRKTSPCLSISVALDGTPWNHVLWGTLPPYSQSMCCAGNTRPRESQSGSVPSAELDWSRPELLQVLGGKGSRCQAAGACGSHAWLIHAEDDWAFSVMGLLMHTTPSHETGLQSSE